MFSKIDVVEWAFAFLQGTSGSVAYSNVPATGTTSLNAPTATATGSTSTYGSTYQNL
jgi:hypothetical protein